ncbi:MAG: GNAT family N-acetyltransferase [Acidimicrobiia bacterium]
MVNGAFEIREVEDGDLDAYYDIRSQSFGRPETERTQWRDRVQRDHDAMRLGAYVAGELVGGLRALPGGQWLNGRSVPMAGLAAVVVRPEVRGQGVARKLLFAALDWMRDRGIAVSTLHPASTRVYRSGGWEIAGTQETVRVNGRSLAAIRTAAESPPEPPVVRLGSEDWPAARACYARAASLHHGFVDRSASFWALREPVDDGSRGFTYGVRGADGLDGYVRYEQRPSTDGWGYRLVVDDFVAESSTVAMALWRFLGAHAMQVPQLEVPHSCTDPLLLFLDEQDLSVRLTNRWMFRMVDVAGAIGGRGYPGIGNGSVSVQVQDPWPGGCTGTWRISVEDGTGHAAAVSSAHDSANTVVTDIGALSALMIGRFSTQTLLETGRMQGSPDAVDALGRLLISPPPVLDDDF